MFPFNECRQSRASNIYKVFSVICFPWERSMPVTAEGANAIRLSAGSLKPLKAGHPAGTFPVLQHRFPPKPISNISTSIIPLPEPSCSLDCREAPRAPDEAVRAPFLWSSSRRVSGPECGNKYVQTRVYKGPTLSCDISPFLCVSDNSFGFLLSANPCLWLSLWKSMFY